MNTIKKYQSSNESFNINVNLYLSTKYCINMILIKFYISSYMILMIMQPKLFSF